MNVEKPDATPLQGQAIVYFGPEADRFHREFQGFGVTVVPARRAS